MDIEDWQRRSNINIIVASEEENQSNEQNKY